MPSGVDAGDLSPPRLTRLRQHFRHQAITGARRVLTRMPSRLQRRTRRAADLVRRLRRLRRLRREPLVSLVVPVYAVERYLAACLDSLLAQSHRRLQVILVDDGSPDRSIDIMRAYAQRDPRVKILRQPNCGLGAARNLGARAARGTYLMFVDSDDTLEPHAVRAHVGSLRRSGSDFSVACYQRLSSAGTWPAAWWIRDAHRVSRPGTRLTDFPDILVNAVAWSKCYRRRFWVGADLSFPEGVLYEDQPVSARAYALARSFDVLSAVLHNWRVRDERSSISQQVADVADLRARLDAAHRSLAELARPGLESARSTRLAQYLNNDFPVSIRASQHGGQELWELLRSGLGQLTRDVSPLVWAQVGVQHRIATRLVVENKRDALIWFVGLGHNNPKHSPAITRSERVYLDTTARHYLDLDAVDPLLAFADHQLGMVTAIRRVFWTELGTLRVEGWAYIDNVSLADPATSFGLTAQCRRLDGEAVIELPVSSRATADVTVASKHRYADYERSGFAVEIQPRDLIDRDPVASQTWQILVRTSAAGICRSGPLLGLDRSGSAGHLIARFVDGVEVIPRYTRRAGLCLHVQPSRCTLETARVVDRVLSVTVRGAAGFVPSEIVLSLERPRRRIRHSLLRLPGNRAEGRLMIPDRADDPTMGPRSDSWAIQVVSLSGTRSAVACVQPDRPSPSQSGSVRPARTRSGQLVIVDEPFGLLVDDVSIDTSNQVRLAGVVRGVAADFLELTIGSPRAHAVATARSTSGGRLEATIPLRYQPWGLAPRSLPSGSYRLRAHGPTADGGDGIELPTVVAQSVIDKLPLSFATATCRGSLRLGAGQGLSLVLEPPLADDERGARPQERLQRSLVDLVSSQRFERGAVLFRSYYGEIAGCNPLAVHRELRRRDAGYRLYWAVKDMSVIVPEGGIPVVHDSADWYRLLHDAEYYLDNMHQPIYHAKPRHQVQIQTFHGYPFKEMGLAHWARQQRDRAHIQSYLDRAEDWDYLVSPASYGTSALTEAFGFTGKVLEIGYPRNDVLLGTDAPAIAAAVRRRLGIAPEQCAVLYAPTFRDEMTKDDYSARMIDFLDVPQLGAALGPGFVVMVRGHAFNARMDARLGSAGNVIDVTDYPDVAELTLASDAAILDYSSLRFDYGLTGKPMIFMVPDLEEYQRWSRGSILPYEPTAPGPLVVTTDEVIDVLRDLTGVRHTFAAAYTTFRDHFLDLDDGHASERLVDQVFER